MKTQAQNLDYSDLANDHEHGVVRRKRSSGGKHRRAFFIGTVITAILYAFHRHFLDEAQAQVFQNALAFSGGDALGAEGSVILIGLANIALWFGLAMGSAYLAHKAGIVGGVVSLALGFAAVNYGWWNMSPDISIPILGGSVFGYAACRGRIVHFPLKWGTSHSA